MSVEEAMANNITKLLSERKHRDLDILLTEEKNAQLLAHRDSKTGNTPLHELVLLSVLHPDRTDGYIKVIKIKC